MSPQTMSYIYYIAIGIFGLIMYLGPNAFMGKAKYDEQAVKTESLIKKSGIALMIFCVVTILYSLFFK